MRTTTLGGLLTASLLLAACHGGAAPLDEPAPTGPATLAVSDPPDDAPPLEQALALAPVAADVLTVTDWDAVRSRLGHPEMTGEDLMTDRLAVREAIRTDVVVFADGQLTGEASALELDHRITPEDVDWEAHWTGDDGATGWAVAFRPDLDAARIEAAVQDEQSPLHGGTVDGHLVVRGDGDEVWASDPGLAGLVASGARPAATYLHQGCTPLRDALGPDATVEDQDRVLAAHDIDGLDPLEAYAVSADDDQLTAWLGTDRADLMDRTNLTSRWPAPTVQRAIDGDPVGDASTGRIAAPVASPTAATGLVLTGELPWVVCDEVLPFEEPTGL